MPRRVPAALALAAFLALAAPGRAAERPVVRVGSKAFTESYLLAEIAARVIEAAGEARVERRLGLGGTGIAFRALATGDIDLYPEYTGTLSRALLKEPTLTGVAALRSRLAPLGLTLSDPIGFSNTYALAVRRETARRLGLRAISDLARHPGLTAAFSSGFTDRADGWPGLRRHYGLRLARVEVMEHTLTYQALASGAVDVIDVFSTDGRLAGAGLQVLADDRGFFPDYAGVLLARRDLVERFPRTWARLAEALVGRLDNAAMARLNAQVDVEGRSIEAVAAAFLGGGSAGPTWTAELGRLTLDHLALVGVTLALAVALGLPLGVLAARRRRLGQVELASVGMLQTVPALALLCFMIPLFGIGKLPALVALVLYALLPIVRNVYTGLVGLDRQLLEIAGVLGLGSWQRLRRIELPLASLAILAGIKTSAVLTVGTATLAAFIGGGGYGVLIVRGLALDDPAMILGGAAPAALMALAIHGTFELLDRVLVPRGLRRTLATPR